MATKDLTVILEAGPSLALPLPHGNPGNRQLATVHTWSMPITQESTQSHHTQCLFDRRVDTGHPKKSKVLMPAFCFLFGKGIFADITKLGITHEDCVRGASSPSQVPR